MEHIGLLLIFWYGILHAFGADHLTAIADFSIGKDKAKTMLITLVNALVSDIEPRCKRKILSKKSTKRRQPIINRTYAISQLKNIIRKTAYSLKDLFNYLKEFIDRISRQLEYSRKGQSVTRKFKPLIKHAMAYKAI